MGKVQSKKNKEKLNSCRGGGMILPSMCGIGFIEEEN